MACPPSSRASTSARYDPRPGRAVAAGCAWRTLAVPALPPPSSCTAPHSSSHRCNARCLPLAAPAPPTDPHGWRTPVGSCLVLPNSGTLRRPAWPGCIGFLLTRVSFSFSYAARLGAFCCRRETSIRRVPQIPLRTEHLFYSIIPQNAVIVTPVRPKFTAAKSSSRAPAKRSPDLNLRWVRLAYSPNGAPTGRVTEQTQPYGPSYRESPHPVGPCLVCTTVVSCLGFTNARTGAIRTIRCGWHDIRLVYVGHRAGCTYLGAAEADLETHNGPAGDARQTLSSVRNLPVTLGSPGARQAHGLDQGEPALSRSPSRVPGAAGGAYWGAE